MMDRKILLVLLLITISQNTCAHNLTTFSDGSSVKDVVFPISGGSSVDAKITLPKGSQVVDFRVDASKLMLDSIFIAVSTADKVIRVNTTSCKKMCEYPVGDNPSRTTVSSRGHVWVGNRNSNDVSLLDGTTCDPLKKVINSSIPTGAGPRALAVDEFGNVWVGGYSDGTVWVYDDATGACIYGNAAGCANPAINVGGGPYGAAADGRGHIWISNRRNGKLNKIDISTKTVTTYNTPGGLYGIDVDGNGNVWVAGYDTRRIYKFDNNGNLLCNKLVGSGARPRGVGVDANGFVWLADCAQDKVHKINQSCDVVASYDVGDHPIGISIDMDGDIWVINYNDKNAYQLNASDGSLLCTVGGFGGNPYTYSDMTGYAFQKLIFDLELDAGSNGVKEFSQANFKSATISSATTTPNISVELTNLLATCTCPGCSLSGDNCTIDLEFTATSNGKITLENLYVEYCTPVHRISNCSDGGPNGCNNNPGISDYPSFDTDPTDLGCCFYPGQCVYLGVCYNNSEAQTFGGDDPTNNSIYCLDHNWYDCDNSEEGCENSTYCGFTDAWVVGGEDGVGEYDSAGAIECCGDDLNEFYNFYDQAEVDGCNDITDEPCVGKDDNLSDNACCDNVGDCVLNHRCYPTDNLTDLDGDGVDGEVCVVSGGKGKWMDCDDNNVLCEGPCSFMYIPGEAGAGEYDFTGAVECCGDDFGEYYVHYDQLDVNGCDDIDDEKCVGKDDDPSDNACCDNETDCVFNHLCYSIGNLTDIDMDTVNGELCVLDMGKGKWMDCDDSQGVCTTDCSSIWIWGGESDSFGEYDTGTDIECCGDDIDEHYNYYDQLEFNGCNDITDERCVGRDDNPLDNACCDNANDCVFGRRCYSTNDLIDVDGDGVNGEVCKTGKWLDCDDSNLVCTTDCSLVWIAGGEPGTPFGEYDTGTSTECCGDDAGEYYVGGTDGTYACCDNRDSAMMPLFDDECVIRGVCQDRIPSPEICNDGKDNDCDGDVDFADLDCVSCALGYRCDACSGWVTKDPGHAPCAPPYNGCVRDSGVGYYDWACCEGVICKIEKETHL